MAAVENKVNHQGPVRVEVTFYPDGQMRAGVFQSNDGSVGPFNLIGSVRTNPTNKTEVIKIGSTEEIEPILSSLEDAFSQF